MRPVLFPRAAVELCRMSALTVIATFGLSIIFLAAAILLAPGSLHSALAVQPVPAAGIAVETQDSKSDPRHDAQGRAPSFATGLDRR